MVARVIDQAHVGREPGSCGIAQSIENRKGTRLSLLPVPSRFLHCRSGRRWKMPDIRAETDSRVMA